jgi:hypothetical protein
MKQPKICEREGDAFDTRGVGFEPADTDSARLRFGIRAYFWFASSLGVRPTTEGHPSRGLRDSSSMTPRNDGASLFLRGRAHRDVIRHNGAARYAGSALAQPMPARATIS